MRIAILTTGSRGDTQPYLALAVGLKRAGHDPVMSAPVIFKDWIESYGISYAPISVNPQEIAKQPHIQKLIKRGDIIRLLLAMKREAEPLMQTSLREHLAAAQGADAVVGSITAQGYKEIGEMLGIPAFTVQLV